LRHPQEIDAPITTRAQRAIRRSSELIRQTGVLLAQNRTFLNQLEARIPFDNILATHRNFISLRQNSASVLNWLLDSALQITNANMGNVQLFDPDSGCLHIAAQYGFDRSFIDYFEYVREGEAACGKAMKTRQRVVIEDVTKGPVFHDAVALEILLDAGVRAVQSTPLITRSGSLLGVFSTHWASPHRLTTHDLRELDDLARAAADLLERPDAGWSQPPVDR
jgi:hypothetical protein